MKEDNDDLLEENEDSLSYNTASTCTDERDRMLLREMQGRAIIVDLDWYPEQDDDWDPKDGELILQDRETFDCQAMACDCMSEIRNMDDDLNYEKMTWNQDLIDNLIVLVPIEIHMVNGPTGNYPRFWGYICQHDSEYGYWSIKKATISLPSGLSKRIATFSEDMLDMRVDPLEDLQVLMILTTYLGLEEFEIDSEKRKAHKFWETKIIQGHRSP